MSIYPFISSLQCLTYCIRDKDWNTVKSQSLCCLKQFAVKLNIKPEVRCHNIAAAVMFAKGQRNEKVILPWNSIGALRVEVQAEGVIGRSALS